jgi:hypothetical protein
MIAFAVALAIATPLAQAKTKYDHWGKAEHHSSQSRYLLAGRTDLFYSGDYTCIPGDEHHAPDCRQDWWVIDALGYTNVALEDGTQIVVFDSDIDINNVFDRLPVLRDKTAQLAFRYRLGKLKDGMQEIEIEGVGKGYYKPLNKTAPRDQHCLALAPERQAECLAAAK